MVKWIITRSFYLLILGSNPNMPASHKIIMNTDFYVSPDRMWAVIPYGKRYMSIHNGQQMKVHTSIEFAKKFIQKEIIKQK